MKCAAVISGLAAAALLLAQKSPAGTDSIAATDSVVAADSGDGLTDIVVTATRVPESSLMLPVAIDRVDKARIRDGQLQVNLSESLAEVPGTSVQNRQNYAQDLQISIRGFGARSSFGVRGIRLYADGIPGTMPDGQGQFAQFDLGSADHIEVLRGPFSALYGNSSGGVIALFTEDGAPGTQLDAAASLGPFGTRRYAFKAAGDSAPLNYVADLAHFETQGYRDHSAAQRNNFNGKLRLELPHQARLTLLANVVETPFVQDPLGLTQAQLANPAAAGTNALTYDTRKNLSQEQAGVAYDQPVGKDLELSALVYGGHRATTQYQAILRANELAVATNPGGVIDLNRGFGGADVHLTDRVSLAGTPLQLTAGLSYDTLHEARLGYLNFIGTQLGVEGALRRDLVNQVFDVDEYLQAQWDPGARWRVLAGVRHSLVDVASTDHRAAPGTPANSAVHYEATNPVFGVNFQAFAHAWLYASYGRGFETPTLNDLAYRSVNGNPPGLNLGLQPAHSNNFEAGVKAVTGGLKLDATAFYIDTHDELAVLQNSGGRSVYQNIPASRRRGAEFSASGDLGGGWSAHLAYTWLRAEVGQAYRTCIALPCVLTTVAPGNRLPAVPENDLYGAVSWRGTPWHLAITVEVVGRAQIYANDLNTQAAPGYWVENLKVGFEQHRDTWQFSEYARVDNLADRRYIDSVIVNESNGRYYEPQPGRAFYVMVRASHR